MVSVLLLLALSGAVERVGVRLEDVQGLAPEEAQALVKELARGIERTIGAGGAAVVDDHLWEAECTRADRCAEEIRARTGASEVVFLKAYATAARLRVIVERAGRSEQPAQVLHSVQADLVRERESWPGVLQGFAQILFPAKPGSMEAASEPSAGTGSSVEEEGAFPIAAWVAVGGGVLLGGTGAGFRWSSSAAATRVEEEPLATDELEREMDRARGHALLSNLFFGAGAVLVTGGLVYLLTR